MKDFIADTAMASAAPTAPGLVTGISGYTHPQLAAERLGTPDIQGTSTTETLINAAAVYLFKQARFNPISSLTPEVLTAQLAEWQVGYMRRFSATMDTIENRDMVVKAATGKLKMALARRQYEIVKVEGADPEEAEAHENALKQFYNNCTATSAVDRNIKGGFSRLVHFMMDAALKRYAPFEIIWQPRGDYLTACFAHVPLYFFENRTGVLRFAGNFAWDGVPLREGRWMVACGEGIMEAVTIGWMYKALGLRDWMVYSERAGIPTAVAKTPHAKNSPAWEALSDAMQRIGADSSIIIGLQDELDKLEFGTSGQLPYPILIEYLDRAIVALARGADLGTLSAHGGGGEGQGASLQGDESDLVEQHYGAMVSETLNHYVDPYVLAWHFGEGTTPCAYVRLNVPKKQDTQLELQVDEKLIGWGVPLSVESALERYGRASAGPDEPVLESQMERMMEQEAQQQGFGANARRPLTDAQKARASRLLVNQAARRACRDASAANSTALEGMRRLLGLRDPQAFAASLRSLRAGLGATDRRTRRELDAAVAIVA